MEAERAERWLRHAVAFVWLATGLLVLHPYYRQVGSEWLARLGLGPWSMWLTCAAEVALAIYLVAIRTTPLWLALGQSATIVTFTVILGVLEPRLLVHYLGMLSKNLPLCACIWGSWLLGREGWTPRATWLLRGGMALPWLTEGVLPKMLFLQPGEVAVVTAFGLSAAFAARLIWLTGLCQASSAVGILVLRGGVLWALYACQVAALVFLPLLVTVVQPSMWVHPFGPLTKSVAILIGTVVVWRRCASFSW